VRQVKIRSWDADLEQFEVTEVQGPLGPVMQWTGIIDRNGREVYEGDIVEAWDRGMKGVFEVRWRNEGVPMYILWPAYQHDQFWHPYGPHDTGLTVIGNIYETPELRPRLESRRGKYE
jgi:hypothetical protein